MDVKQQIHGLSGNELLKSPRFNKGTAFSQSERKHFKLNGLLPHRIESLSEQVARTYTQINSKTNDLDKNLLLNEIYHCNTTLFFKLVEDYLDELLPIIYTPTIGDAVINFSRDYRRPHGLIISYEQIDEIEEILSRFCNDEIDIAVVTDGEGILGIGDQGIGGLNIAIGKLMVYTACAGINPFKTLPIQLDVGTNNQSLLEDPHYLGWRHERIKGNDYYNFMDAFVNAFDKLFPKTFLHWEDFGKDNARKVLNRYAHRHQSFNDDIQGTGAIALAAVLNGIQKSGLSSDMHKFCIFGAGTAGTGIAEQICNALAKLENRPAAEIRKRFYLIDRHGLLQAGQERTLDFQAPFLKTADELRGWSCKMPNECSLLDVVKNAGITVLIGCSTATGAFNQEILTQMAKNCERPIIMPLSNPTSKAEAKPEEILKATAGKALIATGSPFGIVEHDGRKQVISQCNNALVYPGIGLGMLISEAKILTDNMLLAASKTVAGEKTEECGNSALLPGLKNIKEISRKVAVAVAEQAFADKVAAAKTRKSLEEKIREHTWAPEYQEYV